MTKVIYGLVTGGFDPLHGGHMDYIANARNQCDKLFVGLNSDAWLKRKKGFVFMPYEDRRDIISSLTQVHHVFSFNDDDGTAKAAIEYLLEYAPFINPNNFDVYFMNGGDRNENNTAECIKFANNPNVRFLFGVGGTNKRNSSSDLVKAVRDVPLVNRVGRNWGFYEVLSETKSEEPFVQHTKVKRLVVFPGCSLSMQYHKCRNELWFVAEGTGKLDRGIPNTIENLQQGMNYNIYSQGWHRLINHTDRDLVIYEIQYGTKCEEEDIVRR